MKVHFVSDLHLEFADLELPGGEVLILAGDICEVKNIRPKSYDPNNIIVDDENRDRRPDRFIRFFLEECTKYEKVFYVMGNHEHYHGRFDKTYNELKNILPPNVVLLENEIVEHQGVMFMGATLWTNLNKNDSLTAFHLKTMMNDYRLIYNHYKDQNAYFKLIPEETLKTHRRTVEWFKMMLRKYQDSPFVVITHHAPSFKSVPPQFVNDHLMNGGYASDLSELILDNPHIKFWVHGHMHDPVDYEIGSTKVISNPRGYPGWDMNYEQFDPNKNFEIS